MENVEFDGESRNQRYGTLQSNQAYGNPRASGILGWLIEKKIVGSEQVARSLLLVLVILCFLISGYLIYSAYYKGGSASTIKTTYEQKLEIYKNKLPADLSPEDRQKMIDDYNSVYQNTHASKK
ncbi:MAG: hypothetical protein JWO73_809 [Candidatus Taylorbacteria bacterium]|nr:hypothetical protein [Candidatus Taylorbacteria bacterium]